MKGIVTVLIPHETLMELIAQHIDADVFSETVDECEIVSLNFSDDGGVTVSAMFGGEEASLGILHDLAFDTVGTSH